VIAALGSETNDILDKGQGAMVPGDGERFWNLATASVSHFRWMQFEKV